MNTSIRSDFFFMNDYKENILLRSKYAIWFIILSYVFIVKRLGPEIMRTRKPLNLRYIILFFNSIIVLWNLYVCLRLGYFCSKYWNGRCDLKHNAVKDLKIIGYLAWMCLLLKIAELLDTVFFILRKKNNQVSFLHVFHHAVVPLLFWAGLRKKNIGYYSLLLPTMNCGVHVLTYLYYGLSAVGPSVRKYLWWKKYLTRIQITQFFMMLSYMLHAFYTSCEEFDSLEKIIFCTVAVFCVLFLNFYFKSYKKEIFIPGNVNGINEKKFPIK